MIGSSQPVLAIVGDDVILPCHIEPPVNMAKGNVEWSRPALQPEYVLVLQHGVVQAADFMNPQYKKRTSLFHDELPRGNISLKLSRVKLSDEGMFTCRAPTLPSSSSSSGIRSSSSLIQLLVGKIMVKTWM